MFSHPHVALGHKYALDCVDGTAVVCRWVRLAAQRYLDDLAKSFSDPDYPYRFDLYQAERVCNFKELFPHTKGKWAAKRDPFILEPWQCFKDMNIFGWLHRDSGARRFRKALIMVARKNGKSDDAARTGLYMFAADGEFGAEVYSGATTEKQAWEIFRPARLMAMRTPSFLGSHGVQVNAKTLSIASNGSRFEPIIGDPGDGSSPSMAAIDEYHEHVNDRMVDTMATGMGSREQPLEYIVSTAGDNMAGPCYAAQDDAQKVLDGTFDDETLFALIYTLDDPEEEWHDMHALQKSNPNLGVSVSEDFLRRRLDEALRSNRKRGTFKIKHGNVWVGARDAYFDLENWKRNADPELKLEDFEGEDCIVAVDLASKIDIASVCVLFEIAEREFVAFWKHYLPESACDVETTPHYWGWKESDDLTVTDGQITDYQVILDDVFDMAAKFNVKELAYDPAQATFFITKAMEHGIPCVEISPTVKNFSEPMKEIDALTRDGKFHHNGDPVATWMVSNVVAKANAKEEVYPRKSGERNESKIDGIVAAIMAMNRAMPDDAEPAPTSPYDDPEYTMMDRSEANHVAV